MIKKGTYILFSIVILLLVSCQQSQEKEGSNNSGQVSETPTALKDMTQLCDVIYEKVKTKDYVEAEKKILDLHQKWNIFYPQISSSPVATNISTEYSEKMNTMTKNILLFASSEKKNEVNTLIDKNNLQIQIQMESGQKQETQGGNSGGGSSDSQSGGGDSGGGGGDSSQSQEGSQEQQQKEVKVPQEIKDQNYPDLNITEGDLVNLETIIELYKPISEFYGVYRQDSLPHLILLKYYILSIKTNAQLGNWDIVQDHIVSAKETWSLMQSNLPSVNEKMITQFSYSLLELEKVLNTENQVLIPLKSDITIENLESIIGSVE